MESEQSISVIVILGTAAVALFALVTVVVLIIYKRKVHIKDLMIQHYQDDCKKEIAALEKRVEELERSLREPQ